MIDSWELENGLNPLDASDAELDFDSDEVLNKDEYLHNTDPNSSDSDQDSMPDLWEIENNLEPTIDDASEDPDNDGVDNLGEYLEGSDPHVAELRLERYFVPAVTLSVVALVAAGAFVIRQRYW
jgi:hypothetical protein